MFGLVSLASHAAERIPLVESWEFQGVADPDLQQAALEDSAWRTVDLPHDWSIESATTQAAPTGGGGGYFPAGTAWYRKTFDAPAAWRGLDVAIYFEGVYRNAEVWLNGTRIGTHAYGYTPFRLPISEQLEFDAPNELLVRVANEPQPNSRWYTGSGIYRPVWLEVRPPVHFEPDSIFVTTRELGPDAATLGISATIANADELQGDEHAMFVLESPDGSEAARGSVPLVRPDGKSTQPVALQLRTGAPLAWSPEAPQLYTLTAMLRRGSETLQESRHAVGLRTLRWSSQHGLELNGRPIELLGGNVHHDHGLLGAAAYAEAEWRKARTLKDAGFNAVRTAHNPPSEAFLDAADHLGLLVIDEAFDGWRVAKTDHDYSEIFADNWERDLRAMVLRDRNHPSVVMWSIGNEVYERGSDDGVAAAHAMAAAVRQLDRSRPVTIGLNGLGEQGDWSRLDGIFDALDTAGYNYELARHDQDHARRPNRVIYSSESYQDEVFSNWQIAHEHPYVIGDFVWSAIDYLGEAGIGRVFPPNVEARPHWVGDHYPYHGAVCGDIDLIGSRKPISHYRNIVWNRGETLFAAVLDPAPGGRAWNLTKWSVPPALASWTWPGHEGRDLTLEVYSRHPAVRVLLDGALIGEAPTTQAEAFKATFKIPYRPGRLEIAGGNETFVLETAQAPARLRFLDGASLPMRDGQRIAFATVEIVDAQGVRHPAADRAIEFLVDGGRILAVGSGDLTSTESYRANPRRSHQGRALVVVEASPGAGEIILRAEAPGLEAAVQRLR